jgi:hypothetical protein
MKMPGYEPQVIRARDESVRYVSAASAIAPQGCDIFKKVACAAAVAGCLATPNPVACILAVAPNCLDCL